MLYNRYVKMHSKSAFQFKANMAMVSFSSVLISLSEIFSIFLLFKRFESVGYWGFYETARMFGIITIRPWASPLRSMLTARRPSPI